MKKASREALDAYYREADSWATDRVGSLRTSRRIAWIVAGVAVTVALAEAFALVALTPLKTVVPYTLLVDRQTGYVQALDPLQPQTVKPDNALIQSFLVQYVIARESFNVDAIQTDYRKVSLWSVDDARSQYVAGVQVSNPDSPLNLYPRSTIVETRVKSVSPLGASSALVRFDTLRRDRGATPRVIGSWAAVVRYRFTGEPLQVEDRYINPLGFQVVRYRKDPETLPPPEPMQAMQPADRPSIVSRPLPSAPVGEQGPTASPPSLVR